MSTPLPPPPLPAPPVPSPTIRKQAAWFARLGALGLIVAVPVLTWWLIGANPGSEYGSDPTLRPDDYDFMFHQPPIDPSVEQTVGITALVIVVAAVVALLVAARAGRLDRRWWGPIIAMSVAGVVVAVAERVMTAAVVGANIGGGFMLLFGTPFVLVLMGGSVLRASVILRTTRLVDNE